VADLVLPVEALPIQKRRAKIITLVKMVFVPENPTLQYKRKVLEK